MEAGFANVRIGPGRPPGVLTGRLGHFRGDRVARMSLAVFSKLVGEVPVRISGSGPAY